MFLILACLAIVLSNVREVFMVRVYGTPYVRYNRSSCSSPSYSSCPPTPCVPSRVRYAGPSYVRSPWYHRVLPRTVYAPASTTVVVEAPPRSVSVIHRNQNDSKAAAAVVIALAILASIAVAVSISRDCRFVETQCSLPDFFGRQICHDVWECKW